MTSETENGKEMVSVAGDASASSAKESSSKRQVAFDDHVAKGETKEAVRLLRAHEDVEINGDQAWAMLDAIPLDVSEENETEQQILVSLTYAALRKRGLLRGFGAVPVSPEALPLASKELDVAGLESALALPMSALTPKGSTTPWMMVGFGLFGAEFALAQVFGYDPIRTVVPVTAFAFLLDQGLLSGALFESASRLLFPKYKQKVIQHEAGHFLLAYLLGCPIQGFFLSAWDAASAGIRGQAGTVFFDNDLSSQLKANKVTRTAIDRYTIVLMAGIAAEAIMYEQAEGGASDESALVNFLVGLSPPWDQERVFNQARWAVTQAALLLQEHRPAYDNLAKSMAAGASLGECIKVIEQAIASEGELPVDARVRTRKEALEAAPAGGGAAAGGGDVLMPSKPSAALAAIDGQIAEKRKELEAIKAREEALREKLMLLNKQDKAAGEADKAGAGEAASGAQGSRAGGGGWDKDETKRVMDALLKAQRARKVQEASIKNGGDLDALLESASRERQLAEVELKLKQKEMELDEIEAKLKDMGRE